MVLGTLEDLKADPRIGPQASSGAGAHLASRERIPARNRPRNGHPHRADRAGHRINEQFLVQTRSDDFAESKEMLPSCIQRPLA